MRDGGQLQNVLWLVHEIPLAYRVNISSLCYVRETKPTLRMLEHSYDTRSLWARGIFSGNSYSVNQQGRSLPYKVGVAADLYDEPRRYSIAYKDIFHVALESYYEVQQRAELVKMVTGCVCSLARSSKCYSVIISECRFFADERKGYGKVTYSIRRQESGSLINTRRKQQHWKLAIYSSKGGIDTF